MSCLTLERVRELISSFDGPLVIAMHKRGDNINEYFKGILEYIKSYKDKKYNIIELDVSNMPEFCAQYRIVTPCTVVFLNGKKEWVFGESATTHYIETITTMFFNDNADEEEDEEIDF